MFTGDRQFNATGGQVHPAQKIPSCAAAISEWLNEGITSGSDQVSVRTCQTIVRFLESAVREDSRSETGLALGVSEADLGLLQIGSEQEFILEEFH